jgi:ribonuclease HI
VTLPTTLTCETCGDSFTLPAAVRTRYPGWTPKRCIRCRNQASSTEGATPSKEGKPRPSVTRELNLPLAEVLTRFNGGPQDGVFTDGSCAGNPGPGGWGAVVVREGKVIEQHHGSEPATTNNRMELTAIIAGLELVTPTQSVAVYSDSLLVVNTLTKWAAGWQTRGWKRKEGEVKNLDLVQRAWELAKARPLASIQWIRAHNGSLWNEYADSLATAYLRDEL